MTIINNVPVQAHFYTSAELHDTFAIPTPPISEQNKIFIALKSEVIKSGVLDRRYVYYFVKTMINVLAVLGVFVGLYLLQGNLLIQFLLVLPYIFFTVQIVGIVHDAGHRAVASSSLTNDAIGLALIGPFGGASYSWWFDKHNAHHASPNEEDSDPDIDFPIVAFTREQAEKKRGIARWFVRHQVSLYIFLVALVPFNMRIHSIIKLVKGKSRYPFWESIGMASYFVIFGTVLVQTLPLPLAGLFFLLSQMGVGWYLASIFAPNHKGMPAIAKDTPLSFFWKQVITSRDVTAHPLTDFIYLGLNYQVEHHLFPNTPLYNIRKLQTIVKKYCHQAGLPFHETGAIASYREIYSILAEASQGAR